jgi:glycosyltransferase involved in cell wall biosynthesis
MPKVAICVPFHRHVEGTMALSLAGLATRSASECAMLFIQCSGAYVEDNRNGGVEYALSMGIDFDWLFWVDSDMQFPPDALVRLMAHDKDIVGANYRQRTPPYKSAGHYLPGEDVHITDPGLWPMGHLPTGLMLTRFEIYRKLAYPWFKPGLQHEMRDDVYFCYAAKELGYEVWCDHDLTFETVHLGDQQIPWFTHEQNRPVMMGSGIDNGEAEIASRERAILSREKFYADAAK